REVKCAALVIDAADRPCAADATNEATNERTIARGRDLEPRWIQTVGALDAKIPSPDDVRNAIGLREGRHGDREQQSNDRCESGAEGIHSGSRFEWCCRRMWTKRGNEARREIGVR